MVDVDASLGEQLLNVPVGEPVAQVPPRGQQDHVRREPEPDERPRGRRSTDQTFHCPTPADPSPIGQRNEPGRTAPRRLLPSTPPSPATPPRPLRRGGPRAATRRDRS